MTSPRPTRQQADLADVLEMVLDKGIVINADIAVTVNQTELLGVEIRAAIASFETAAEYGLAFPSGTDMRRVEQASGRESLEGDDTIDLGIEASSGGASEEEGSSTPARKRPAPQVPFQGGLLDDEEDGGDDEADEGTDDPDEAENAEAADEAEADQAADESDDETADESDSEDT